MENPLNQVVDDHFTERNAQFVAQVFEQVVGKGPCRPDVLDLDGDCLGLSTADDDGKPAIAVHLSKDQRISPRVCVAVGNAEELQLYLFHAGAGGAVKLRDAEVMDQLIC